MPDIIYIHRGYVVEKQVCIFWIRSEYKSVSGQHTWKKYVVNIVTIVNTITTNGEDI